MINDYLGCRPRIRSITVPVTHWSGFLLTTVIIICRSIIPGSYPMEDWSVWSWIFITVPILFPLYLFILVYMVKYLLIWICELMLFIFKQKKNRIY